MGQASCSVAVTSTHPEMPRTKVRGISLGGILHPPLGESEDVAILPSKNVFVCSQGRHSLCLDLTTRFTCGDTGVTFHWDYRMQLLISTDDGARDNPHVKMSLCAKLWSEQGSGNHHNTVVACVGKAPAPHHDGQKCRLGIFGRRIRKDLLPKGK